MTNRFTVLSEVNGQMCVRGVVTRKPNGWRFISHTDAHNGSRKLHETPEKAIPRWVGKYTLEPRT